MVRSLNPAGSAGSKQEDAPLILRVSNVAAAALAPRLQRSEGIQTQRGTRSVDDPQRFHTAAGFNADLARRISQFRQYGNFTMAFATLQPGMSYFEADGGYLAYDSNLGTTFVLGDPVARLKTISRSLKNS